MNRTGDPQSCLPLSGRYENTVFVLPSLDPGESIVSLAEELHAAGGETLRILIVDDGSRAEKQEIFDRLTARSYCTVLRHPVNLGKGAALKTAFQYLLKEGKCTGCVTADGDGQHLVKDILQAAEQLRARPDALILGCRVFSGGHVPWKSRFGNDMTKFMFRAVLRLPVTDTQTGLRGIPAAFMERCLAIPGRRFEFETQMLLETRRTGTPIVEFPIETVYFDANAGTHFHPVKDACRIYGVIFRFLFGEFFRFILSSVSAAAIDFALFCLLFYFLLPAGHTWALPWGQGDPRLFLSCLIARLVSSVWNYAVNRCFVFRTRAALPPSLAGYYLLCAAIFAASWLLTALCTHFLAEKWIAAAKPAVDALLFLVCYFTQKHVVFRTRKSC